MAKKTLLALLLLILAWWGYGFISAIMDSKADMPREQMDAKMADLDPIRKSGYRTYKANFTEDSKTAADIQRNKRALDAVME